MLNPSSSSSSSSSSDGKTCCRLGTISAVALGLACVGGIVYTGAHNDISSNFGQLVHKVESHFESSGMSEPRFRAQSLQTDASSSHALHAHSQSDNSFRALDAVGLPLISRAFQTALSALTANSINSQDAAVTGTSITQSGLTLVGGSQRRLAGGKVDFTVNAASSKVSVASSSASSTMADILGVGPDTLIDYRLVVANPSPLSSYTTAGSLLSPSVDLSVATPAGIEFPSLAIAGSDAPTGVTLPIDATLLAKLGNSSVPTCAMFSYASSSWSNYGTTSIGTTAVIVTSGPVVSNTITCYPRVPGTLSIVSNSSLAAVTMSSNMAVQPAKATVWSNQTYSILIWIAIAVGVFAVLGGIVAFVYKASQLPEAKAGGLRAGLRAGARHLFRRGRRASTTAANPSRQRTASLPSGRTAAGAPDAKTAGPAVPLTNQVSKVGGTSSGLGASKDDLVLETDAQMESTFV